MMKKTIIAGLLTMATVGSASVSAASGDSIGSGNLTVTGKIGSVSTCSVSFPGSVTMPTIEKSAYDAAANLSAVTRTQTPGVVFTGCSGSTVNVSFNSTDGNGWSGNILRVITPGDNVTRIGLQLADDMNVAYWPGANVKNDGRMSNLAITSESHTIPIVVKAMRMSTSSLPVSVAGEYSAQFVFNATYA
ncbi:hypothetical protein LFQ38_004748 [Escherichia coli]|nr:hypothetical protein [Escherichia coli]